MKKLNSILENLYRINERKNIGIVYHFTDYSNLISILTQDMMSLSSYEYEGGSEEHFFSTTRDKNFSSNNIWSYQKDLNAGIKIDGNKLSDILKVSPFNYWGKEDSKEDGFYQDNVDIYSRDKKDEREERFYVPERYIVTRGNSEFFKGINKYIISAMLSESSFKWKTENESHMESYGVFANIPRLYLYKRERDSMDDGEYNEFFKQKVFSDEILKDFEKYYKMKFEWY